VIRSGSATISRTSLLTGLPRRIQAQINWRSVLLTHEQHRRHTAADASNGASAMGRELSGVHDPRKHLLSTISPHHRCLPRRDGLGRAVIAAMLVIQLNRAELQSSSVVAINERALSVTDLPFRERYLHASIQISMGDQVVSRVAEDFRHRRVAHRADADRVWFGRMPANVLCLPTRTRLTPNHALRSREQRWETSNARRSKDNDDFELFFPMRARPFSSQPI
jgi:hypothetical protein